MSVSLTGLFIGLSGDAKPTTNVAGGSLFYEYDTKNEYIFNGTMWYLHPTPAVIVDPLPAGTNTVGKFGIDPTTNTVQDADAGNSATGIDILTGGVGKIGWLSGIYDRLSKVVIAAGNSIIGKVGIDQTEGQNVVSFGAIPQPVSMTGSLANITGSVQNVTTAGTRVCLPDIPCQEVTIIAKRTNAGFIYAGGSNVSSTTYGVELAALESYTFPVANANQIYIDVSVSGEGISYVAI